MKLAAVAPRRRRRAAPHRCAPADAASAADDDRMPVTAAFYPLQFAAERVGGDHVDVTSLTKPGAEPHDLELTPRAVGALAGADVVVYLAGFQPAVDDAVTHPGARMPRSTSPPPPTSRSPRPTTVTTTRARARRSTRSTPTRPAPRTRTSGSTPSRLAAVATALGERLRRRDPANAADYRANAAALVADLDTLDDEFAGGPGAVPQRRARHRPRRLRLPRRPLRAAARRASPGVSPDTEPDAATLRELAAHVGSTASPPSTPRPSSTPPRRDPRPRDRRHRGRPRPPRGAHRRLRRHGLP